MDDDLGVELTDLAIDEIRELMLEAGADISVEQAEQLAAFVGAAGGIHEALQALHQLTQQRDAGIGVVS